MDDDPDFAFWACTQAINDGPSTSRENPPAVDDFGYIVLNDLANNECYILKEGENTIGRHPLNHIHIEHPSVSMNHAVIQCDSDGVVLLDKGSLNKTRLNKKILKKNVAYFLEENALLIFGEVQANYYVDTVPSDTTNIKTSKDTLVQKTTGNSGCSAPKLSNTISTSNNSGIKDTSNNITGPDAFSVTGNSSSYKTETTIPNSIAEFDQTKDNLNDVHSELISPSPSDEFLLDAISQIETNQIKVNSSENLPNKNTSSLDMKSTDFMPATRISRVDNNIVSITDSQELSTEVMLEATREDTPSPVMDLGPLIDYDNRLSVQESDNYKMFNKDTSSPDMNLTESILTENVLRIDNNVTPLSDVQTSFSKVIPETSREDTPSPVMDLGPLINYDISLSVQKPDNHNMLSFNESANKYGEFNETQLMKLDNNVSKNCSQIFPTNSLSSKNTTLQVSKSPSGPAIFNNINQSNMFDECTQLPVMDKEDLLSMTSKSVMVNCNTRIEENNSSDLSTFTEGKSDCMTKNVELNNGNNFNSLKKKSSTSQKENIIENHNHVFDRDDDDILISEAQKIDSFETQDKNVLQINNGDNLSDLDNTKSDNNSLNKSEKNQVFNNFCERQNPSTSTYSKPETVFSKKKACEQNYNTFEADDDDIFNDFIQEEFNSQSHTSTRNIGKDSSYCPLQKTTLYEQEPLPDVPTYCKKTNLDTSNTGCTSKSKDLNQVSEMDDNDFFNCPTQKVSISKKMSDKKKPTQCINELETQPLPDMPLYCKKTNLGTSNTGCISKSKDLNQVSEMDDDDFFNCPTQKVSISKKMSDMKKLIPSIDELDTQPIPDLPTQPNNTNFTTSCASSSSKSKNLNQAPKMDDDDFFNCPTQKVSISKKMSYKKTPTQCINELETQPLPDVPLYCKKTNLDTSNTGCVSKSKDVNLISEMDDDDFFNWPTQKISISKKMSDMKKLTQSINELETQPIPGLPTRPNNSNFGTSHVGSTSKSKSLNLTPKMDDDDIFNCPTQKLSISKNLNETKKPSLSINELETQPLPDLPTRTNNTNIGTSYAGSISKSKDFNQEASKMNDDDIFNCPTQKLSISKNLNETKKSSQSINELETQPIPGLPTCPNNTNFGTSHVGSTSKSKSLNLTPQMDNDDIFNCPTQKVLINKTIHVTKKLSLSTKTCLSSSISGSACKSKDINQVSKLSDDDFFNCPTQKLSISKKMNEMKNLSLSIHEQETEPILGLPNQLTKIYSNTSIIGSTSKSKDVNQVTEIDDDFFNCPTQRVSTSKKIDRIKNSIQSINELETQPLPILSTQPNNSNLGTSHASSSSKSKDLNQAPKMDDDDIFNCPTQKVSISKKIDKMKKSINELETQPLPDVPSHTRRTYLGKSNSDYISKAKNLNQVSEMDDDDFFNCPTQKISINKKINEIKNVSLSIHEQETAAVPKFSPQPRKTHLGTPIADSSNKNNNLNLEIDDEDFFNYPTQKLSFSKKMNEMKKLPQSIHEQETQPLADLPTPQNNTNLNASYAGSTSKAKNLNQVSEMDDDDFFNCPTQKLSISKKINGIKKLPQSIHEQETQHLPGLPTSHDNTNLSASYDGTINKSKDLNQVPELDDDDFFNYPTQKVSISKKMSELKKLSQSINELETQPLPDLPTPPKNTNLGTSYAASTSKSKDLNRVPELANDDFFNCPTQKVSINNKMIEMKNPSLSIYEQETEPLPDFSPRSSKIHKGISKTISPSKSKDLNSKMDDEDFFNLPTQPLPEKSPPSNTCKRNHVTKRHKDSTLVSEKDQDFFNLPTQILPDNSQPCSANTTIFNFHVSSSIKDSTQISLDDKNGFNNITQKLLPCVISSSGIKKQNVFNINEADTQELSSETITTVYNTKTNLTDNKKQNKENIFNCTIQKGQTKIQLPTNKDDTEEHAPGNDGIPYITKSNFIPDKSKRLCSRDVSDGYELSNKKQSIDSDLTDMHMIRKSSRIHSTSTNKPNVQQSTSHNQNQNLSKSSKNKNKPIIYVRKDLHVSCSDNLENNPRNTNKSNQNVENKNIMTSTNNILEPSCSKTTPDVDNGLNLLSSIKQEPLADDSELCQDGELYSLRRKCHSKQRNETTFSSSNKPSTSTNPLLKQHQNPIAIQNNVDLPNCQPSTSNDSSSQWKSFWNQKKLSSQNKGKSGNQKNSTSTNDIVVKKERYQTRANAKKDNSEDLSRKRKQDNVNTEECNKRVCKDDTGNRLNPPVQETSDIVVTFSYLKSRNLLEMKQFVEVTGGYVTDEITECSVLVTDKVRCSMKVLSAIAKGCPIVDANWVKHSYTVKMFQDVNDFIISDKDAERKHKFKLKESLARAKANGLLNGYTVMVTPSVKPSPKDMKVIITCAGGNFVVNWPKKRQPKELIVTCEQDRRRWKSLWDNNKAKTIDNDAFIMSIMRQKLSI